MKNMPSTRLFGSIKTDKRENMRFMEPRIGMADLPSPLVNRKVKPMVELIQQKECDIHYAVEQLKESYFSERRI
jgi:hypothetical protein